MFRGTKNGTLIVGTTHIVIMVALTASQPVKRPILSRQLLEVGHGHQPVAVNAFAFVNPSSHSPRIHVHK